MKKTSRARKSPDGLIILDMLSEFEFPQGAALARAALAPARAIAKLRRRAHDAGVPVIYVNDTRGHWESDQREFVARCLKSKGQQIAELLEPTANDFLIFKPRHSAFYGTPLTELLERFKANHLILTGMTSHQCVLFSAVDAYVRNFTLHVPRDCIGACRKLETHHALYILSNSLRAKTGLSSTIRF